MVIPVLETLAGRFKSPYYGSFALAWIVSAWQPLYVTFVMSADELPLQPGTALRYPDKLSYIWTIPTLTWCRLFWLPIICGLLTPLAIQALEGAVAFCRVKIEQWWASMERDHLGQVHIAPAEYQRVVSSLDLMTKERDHFAGEVSRYRRLADEAEADRQTHKRDADEHGRQVLKMSADLEKLQQAYADRKAELHAISQVLQQNETLTARRESLDRLINIELQDAYDKLRDLSATEPRAGEAIALMKRIRDVWQVLPLIASEPKSTASS